MKQLIQETTVLISLVHRFQTSGRKELLFESKQQLNDSVDNRTQSKLFHHKSSLIVPKQDHKCSHASFRKLDLIGLTN